MACTTILVGKKASYDGSTMIARNDDSGSGHFTAKKFTVVHPEDLPKVYRSVLSHVEVPLPEGAMRFTAMHNAMSSRLPGAQLLAAVRLQDLCGNDAYLEVRRMPGEHCATVCYSTMGRRGLNFQLFRKGWMLCHNESGQLTGQFPAKAESLLEDTDFHACCREDRLDAARTDRMVQELETLAGTDCDRPLPRDARTGAVITVDSFVGRGAHWSYSTLSKAPCLPVAAILYWLADSLAGAERRTLQADPEAAQLAAQWQSGTVEMFFHPAVPAAAQLQTQPQTPPVSRPAHPARPAPTCARTKSWQSILAVMASM